MDNNKTELHILNGDFALRLWKECKFSGEACVWQETYLEGPLPETDNLHTFWQARAEYLSTFEELKGISSSKLYCHVKKLDETLLHIQKNSKVFLWFDACIFDQTLLMRILSLLNKRENNIPEIYLYCCSGNILTKTDFIMGVSQSVQLQKKDLETANKAWSFFQRKDANNLVKLAKEGDFERILSIKKSLFRCAEEIQLDNDGLNRTQRQILELVKQHKNSFVEIFTNLNNYEELPFLGDTACQRILNNLVEKGWLMLVQDKYYLTK